MIEYMSRQAGDHPRSGRRDNSFMPRRPYAGVAPAQPGPTPVASTSTSAGAARGLHHLRMSKTSSLPLHISGRKKWPAATKFFRRHPSMANCQNFTFNAIGPAYKLALSSWPAATKAEVSGPTRPPYAWRLASRISPRSGSRSNSIILRRPYLGVCDSIKNTRHLYFQFKFRVFSISFNYISISFIIITKITVITMETIGR